MLIFSNPKGITLSGYRESADPDITNTYPSRSVSSKKAKRALTKALRQGFRVAPHQSHNRIELSGQLGHDTTQVLVFEGSEEHLRPLREMCSTNNS